MWRSIAIAYLFLASSIVLGQGPNSVQPGKVATAIAPTSGTVGQHFMLTMRTTTQSDKPLHVEPLDEDFGTTWTIVGKPLARRQRSAGATVHDITVKLAPFFTGALMAPQMALEWVDASGSTVTLVSEPIPVTIASVLAETTGTLQLKSAKAPVPLPVPKVLKYIGWAFACAVVLALLFMAWRRWGHRVRAMMNPLSPDAEAWLQLSKLEDEKLIEQKRIREYYTRLADSLREYAGKVYGVPALDLTTSELVAASEIKSETAAPDHRDPLAIALKPLQHVLEEADLVKFARFYPEEKQARHALEQAREVISTTRAVFAPVPPGKSAVKPIGSGVGSAAEGA